MTYMHLINKAVMEQYYEALNQHAQPLEKKLHALLLLFTSPPVRSRRQEN